MARLRTASLVVFTALVVVAATRALPAQDVMGGAGGGITFSSGRSSAPGVPLDPAADPPSTTDRISGVVISSIDSKPVSRVLVTSADRRFAALTDDGGRFSFDLRRPVPQPGDANSDGIFPQQNTIPTQFQLRKPGYTQASVMVYLSTAHPDTPQPPIQFVIQPSGTITGRVDVESGDAAGNLYITLYRKMVQNGRAFWNQTASPRVQPDGRFRAANLAPGDYKLVAAPLGALNGRNEVASINGLLPAYNSNATSLDTAPPIHIAAGETVSANLILRRGAFYRITIPVAGDAPRVTITPDLAGRDLAYNAKDQALEGYLPNGDYDAHLSSTAFGPSRIDSDGVVAFVIPDASRANTTPLCATVHISVHGAPVHPSTAVTLHPVPEIPVEVTRDYTETNTSSNPNIQLDPNRRDYDFSLQPTEQNSSQVIFGPVRNNRGAPQSDTIRATGGTYNFVFFAGQAYAASITSGGMDLLQQSLVIDDSVAPQPIFVTMRNDGASLEVHLAQTAATMGMATQPNTVLYAIAIPLDRPESQPIGPQGFSSTQALAQGLARIPSEHATFGNLPPGHYLILTAHDPQPLTNIEYRNPDVLRDLAAQGATVTLTPGQKADIDVPLMSGPSFTNNQVVTLQ